MKLLLPFLLIGLISCTYDDLSTTPDNPGLSKDYLAFGTFYGMCAGNCVNVFVIQDNNLYQVNNPKYISQQQRYDLSSLTKLSDEKYQLVKDLDKNFPSKLSTETQTVFGCPDCADGGGTYLEISVDGEVKYWFVDNTGRDVPLYIRDYVDKVIAATRTLRQ